LKDKFWTRRKYSPRATSANLNACRALPVRSPEGILKEGINTSGPTTHEAQGERKGGKKRGGLSGLGRLKEKKARTKKRVLGGERGKGLGRFGIQSKQKRATSGTTTQMGGRDENVVGKIHRDRSSERGNRRENQRTSRLEGFSLTQEKGSKRKEGPGKQTMEGPGWCLQKLVDVN